MRSDVAVPGTFTIATSHRTIELQAENAEVKQKWVRALDLARQKLTGAFYHSSARSHRSNLSSSTISSSWREGSSRREEDDGDEEDILLDGRTMPELSEILRNPNALVTFQVWM